jgi:hypothetical protein
LSPLAKDEEGQYNHAGWQEVCLVPSSCFEGWDHQWALYGLPHDHDAWAFKKAKQKKHYREKRERDKEAKSPDAAAGSAKNHKSNPTDEKLKLALSDKLTSALVTQYHLSQTEADELFKTAYNEAQEK